MTTWPGTTTPDDPELRLPPPMPVSRDSTAGVAVMAHLRRQTAALLEASPHVRKEVEAVHAARVAARRLRSGLRIYGDLLEGDLAHRLRPELSWYAGALSPVRDLDVFLLHLAPDDAAAETLVPWLRARRDVAVADASASLSSSRAEALRRDLVAAARSPRFTRTAGKRARKVLAPRVVHADTRARNRIESLIPGDEAESWHAARIAAKRARYAAEVGTTALGRPCADLAAIWEQLTEPLGEAQDAVVQRRLVQDRVEDSAYPLTAAEAFACGEFVAASRARELAAHARARVIWNRSRDAHARARRAVANER